MKYTAITVDGKPYGVQPTMEKPKYHERMMMNFGYGDRLKEYESHLLARPRYLRTQGLELLPDGEEFEARIVNEVFTPDTSNWDEDDWNEAQREARNELPPTRRQVLAPLVKDQDVASVQNEAQRLVDYIYEFAWHYGRFYHFKDAEKIKAAISERFQMPEEFIKSLKIEQCTPTNK